MPILIFLLLNASSVVSFADTDYRDRYHVDNLYTKIVDNQGKGEERLYGLRNVRILFPNVLRGGANNVYHRSHPRSNTHPLPEDGLQNLCLEGFEHAIYLYPTHFETAPNNVECRDQGRQIHQLVYHQLLFGKLQDEVRILELIHEQLKKKEGGLYLHCWNGWHASGYISAISLIQFCGMSSSDAVIYWDRNTDGLNQKSRYELIRQRIRNFKPMPNLQLDEELKKNVCIP